MKRGLLGILMCALIVLAVSAQGHALGFGAPVSAPGTCLGAGNVIATITGFNWPTGIAADSYRGKVYVANVNPTIGSGGSLSFPAQGYVAVIDEKTNTITKTIPVGAYPYAMALDPFHGKVFVVDYLSASISVIDENTDTVSATITGISNFGHGIAVDPVRGKVYVVTALGTFWIVDEATGTVVTSVALPTSGGGVGVDPITGNIYAAINPGKTNAFVEVFDPTTYALTATIPLTTPEAEWVAVDPIGKKLYATGSNAYNESAVGALFVIDTATNTLTNTIPAIHNDTIAPAFDPINRKVYVTSIDYKSNEGGVMVIDAVSDTVIETFTLNAAFSTAVDPIRRTLYVTFENGTTTDVISIGGPEPWGSH